MNGQVETGAHSELAVNDRELILDGLLVQAELFRNLPVGRAAEQRRHQVSLMYRQPGAHSERVPADIDRQANDITGSQPC